MSSRTKRGLLAQEYITFCLRRDNEIREQRQQSAANKKRERGSRNAIADKKAQA